MSSPPILISTVDGKCLNVCLYAIEEYAPDCDVYLQGSRHFYHIEERDFYRFRNPTNFGDDYNALMDFVFVSKPDLEGVIISNDDVVITPFTLKYLLSDLKHLQELGKNVGLLTARSDAARPPQDIRWMQTGAITQVPVVSPIFCYVSRKAFNACQLPPINWFGDDVWSYDLVEKGFEHFVSRAYVHHVGSQTIGYDAEALAEASTNWVRTHRPQYMERFGITDEEE